MLQKFFKKFLSIKQDRENLLNSAKKEADEIVIKARSEALKLKEEAERKAGETATVALEVEKRLSKREEMLEEKENNTARERQSAIDTKNHFEKLKKELEDKRTEMLQKLEKIAKMTKDEAKELLLRGWEDRLKEDIAKKIKAAEEEIKTRVDDKAKSILVDAMRYGAIDYVAEYTL